MPRQVPLRARLQAARPVGRGRRAQRRRPLPAAQRDRADQLRRGLVAGGPRRRGATVPLPLPRDPVRPRLRRTDRVRPPAASRVKRHRASPKFVRVTKAPRVAARLVNSLTPRTVQYRETSQESMFVL